MMNYFILKHIVTNDDYVAEKVKISDTSIYEERIYGTSFKEKNLKIDFYKDRGELKNVIDNLYGLFVVSESLKDTITNICQNEIEFFLVNLHMKTDINYYFINILHNIDAIDYENSIYELYHPSLKRLSKVDSLKLIESNIIDRNIFRLNGYPYEILISEKLKTAIEEINTTEFKFIPVEEYKFDPMNFDD